MDRSMARRMLLERIYDRMSDEEKRLFVRLAMEDRDAEEIRRAMGGLQAQLDRIERRQNPYLYFGADVAANFLTDGLVWLGRRLLKR